MFLLQPRLAAVGSTLKNELGYCARILPPPGGRFFDSREAHALCAGRGSWPGGVKSLEADGSETVGEAFSRAGSTSVQIGETVVLLPVRAGSLGTLPAVGAGDAPHAQRTRWPSRSRM